MRQHLILTILMQIKDVYDTLVKEERIYNAPVLDENILTYDPLEGYVDARLWRNENLADAFYDLINSYKQYYKLYTESVSNGR